MSKTSLNTFESRPELLNACTPRRPTDPHEETPLRVEVPEIAAQSSFSLFFCLRFLCRSIAHSRGSQYSLPHRMFRILGRLCFRVARPRAGPRLRFSILRGLFLYGLLLKARLRIQAGSQSLKPRFLNTGKMTLPCSKCWSNSRA